MAGFGIALNRAEGLSWGALLTNDPE